MACATPAWRPVVADSHQALPVDRRELADMDSELLPYRLLIANGLPAVMVAHVLYPAVDSLPASFSHRWVSGILRGELHFKGTIFTDDLSMLGAAGMGDIVERCQRALQAGCDVLPVCNSRDGVVQLLQELRHEPDASLHMRLARMRGHAHFDHETLMSSDTWQQCQQSMARCGAPAELSLGGG